MLESTPETPSVLPEYLHPYAAQVDQLRRVGNIFWQRGWSLGTSSNYSVVVNRNPLQLLVTASGKDKGQLSREDFVLVDGEGKPIRDHQPKSSAETLLHCVAAQQENVGAILHTHSVWSTILSERFAGLGGLMIEGFEMLKGLSGVTTHEHREWLPIFENTQDIPVLAKQVSAAMHDTNNPLTHGYLIRRHGIYTWGRDLDEATRQIEIIEFLLECIGRQIAMG
ncbi:MAG: methylthioribulose 1-phosphate dehydratase [Pirellulaceae bacterium]|nr:methylthioribulose 1-phosphate dehydratase [Pirellulaceae bacterium]